MIPITIVFAGINDHLHSREFLSRLREPTKAEDAVWLANKDIFESIGEILDTLKEGHSREQHRKLCLHYLRDMHISRMD